VRNLIECPPPIQQKNKKEQGEQIQQKQQEAGNPQEGSDSISDGNDPENQQHENQEMPDPVTTKEEPEPETTAMQALRNVFQEMELATAAVAPRKFCQDLGIPVMEQQDSQEFWKLLLPALKVPALTDLYQGAFEDYIKALDGSNRERRREEQFLDLSLDVSR
jgi:hypothetical protein